MYFPLHPQDFLGTPSAGALSRKSQENMYIT